MATLTLSDIDRLTTAERLELIGQLWDSLAEAPPAVSAAQRRELDRRLASFEQDRPDAVSWDDLKVELAAHAS